MSASTYVALLRGINVGGHNRVPMTELRALCAEAGWTGVQTYIQSGNVLFQAESTATGAEEALERLITQRYGLSIPVVVRTARDWSTYVLGNPYPEASEADPNLVMLALSKHAPKRDAVNGLRERAVSGERVARVGDALWIHFGRGVARSKLSPALLDRLVGSPVTMRNWRTVLNVEELARRLAA